MTWSTERVSFALRPEAAQALDTKEVKIALPKYRVILLRKAKSKFQRAKKSGALDKKSKAAYEILKSCELCERKCRTNRTAGQPGWCKLADKLVTSSAFQHWGEEAFLVPSFTVFFWSCTFSCQYCQNWTISQRIEPGQTIEPEQLAKEIDAHAPICRNVNFVGGEPTPLLPLILQTLKRVRTNIPVIWNSNFYMSESSMKLLRGVIDVYLSDWKYWSNKCALRLSKVPRYLEVVKRNHLLALKDSELVIRHLVLPSHVECCSKPILKWVAENLGKKVIINIMNQYRPAWRAFKYKEIAQPITKEQFQQVVDLATQLDLNFIT